MYLVTVDTGYALTFPTLEDALRCARESYPMEGNASALFVCEVLSRYDCKKSIVITDYKPKRHIPEQFPS